MIWYVNLLGIENSKAGGPFRSLGTDISVGKYLSSVFLHPKHDTKDWYFFSCYHFSTFKSIHISVRLFFQRVIPSFPYLSKLKTALWQFSEAVIDDDAKGCVFENHIRPKDVPTADISKPSFSSWKHWYFNNNEQIHFNEFLRAWVTFETLLVGGKTFLIASFYPTLGLDSYSLLSVLPLPPKWVLLSFSTSTLFLSGSMYRVKLLAWFSTVLSVSYSLFIFVFIFSFSCV